MPPRKPLGQYKVEAILKHGPRNYNYSKISGVVRKKDAIVVVCPEHGEWVTTFDIHNSGRGCVVCSGNAPTKQQRIDKAHRNHAGRYDYSLWPENVVSTDTVRIVCPDHGTFTQTVNNHVNHGMGCPSCNGTPRKTTEQRKHEASRQHGSKYDYSLWPERLNARTVVTSICPEHGEWRHNIDNHVRGKGCPCCAVTGFDESKEGCIYLLRDELGRVKIGISNNIETRIKQLRRYTPFPFEVVGVFIGEGRTTRRVEKVLHGIYPTCGLKGFDGATEWRTVLEFGEMYAVLGFAGLINVSLTVASNA